MLNEQLTGIQQIFGPSELPFCALDEQLYLLWANDAALSCYPMFSAPDGFLFFMRSFAPDNFEEVVRRGGSMSIQSLLLSDRQTADLFFTPFCGADGSFQGATVQLSLAGGASREEIHEDDLRISTADTLFRNNIFGITSALPALYWSLSTENFDASNHLKAIGKNCNKMLRAVKQLTEIGRFVRGVRSLQKQNGDFVSFLRELCAAAASITEPLGIPITFDTDEKFALAQFDPKALSTVFFNLITNACQYTRDYNSIRVSLRLRDEREFLVSVADRGAGIPPDELPRIFDAFYYYDPDRRPGLRLGLGLTLCKAICMAHGGNITAISSELEGSVFTFALPVIEPDADKMVVQMSHTEYITDRFSPLYVGLAEIAPYYI